MEQDILEMYDVVFKDIVKDYIADYNEAKEENKIELTEEEIKTIVHNIIYDNDYLWGCIYETINCEIEYIYNKR